MAECQKQKEDEMVDNLLQTGGAGGLGAFIGAIASFFGFKRRIERLEDNVVYKDGCIATVTGLKEQMNTQTNLMTEMREDIKTILKNGK